MNRSHTVRLFALLGACVLAPAVLSGALHLSRVSNTATAEVGIHLFSYMVFTVLVYVAALSLKKAGAAACLLAITTELLQLMSRGVFEPSVVRVLLNVIGIALGCMVVARTRVAPLQRRMTWMA